MPSGDPATSSLTAPQKQLPTWDIFFILSNSSSSTRKTGAIGGGGWRQAKKHLSAAQGFEKTAIYCPYGLDMLPKCTALARSE
jgi:hypothetical protein